ncbi:MAG: S-methyl-5'-thioinosine phosphorylase [Arenicella sp.]
MTIAIIGGSGFSELDHFVVRKAHSIVTPYGETSAPVLEGVVADQPVFFLARHGQQHQIQPHLINYRANIAALAELGVDKVIGLAAVGGIDEACSPGQLILPDQLMDYTYARDMTFFDQQAEVAHAEFTEPYSAELRESFIQCAQQHGIELVSSGTYAVTQGPRFETRAEILRYQRDGATIVGMTAMPEAVLAREKGMAYITIASSVNFAAGVQAGVISHEDIHQAYTLASDKLYTVLPDFLRQAAVTDVFVPDLIKP